MMTHVRQWGVERKIAVGFLVVLLQALSVGLFALWRTARTSGQLSRISSEYLPEMQLASDTERQLLNARIQFIYFVTVQKAGCLEKGWQRFRAAKEELPKLRNLVKRSQAFAGVRPDVDQLSRDFDNYEPVLQHISDVVQGKQNHGPEFAALIDEWAGRGGAIVDSAGRLSRHGVELADESARQASSRGASITLAGACLTGLMVGLALTFSVTTSITGSLREILGELRTAAGG